LLEPVMGLQVMRAQRAFTLIEMLVVVVILGTVLTLVAPTFREMILMKRLSGINSQLVTDLQFARSEAAARNAHVRLTFRSNGAMTCYTIYTYDLANNNAQCDCLLSPACTAANLVEIRTVQIPADAGVTLSAGSPFEFAYEPITGSLWKIPTDFFSPALTQFTINAVASSNLRLRTVVSRSGRPTVCAPAGSKMQVVSC
jgi:type IV fimbrial biogenesis protein FimT